MPRTRKPSAKAQEAKDDSSPKVIRIKKPSKTSKATAPASSKNSRNASDEVPNDLSYSNKLLREMCEQLEKDVTSYMKESRVLREDVQSLERKLAAAEGKLLTAESKLTLLKGEKAGWASEKANLKSLAKSAKTEQQAEAAKELLALQAKLQEAKSTINSA